MSQTQQGRLGQLQPNKPVISLFFFFLHWLGWTQPTPLGWAGKGLALPMLVAFCHLHAKSNLDLEDFWRRKKRGRLAWPKEKRGWRCSWWYREDQRVVGYSNDDEDAVVTVVQKRLMKEEEKKLGKCCFSQLWPLIS